MKIYYINLKEWQTHNLKMTAVITGVPETSMAGFVTADVPDKV